MRLCNDFSSQRMISGDIDSVIIVDQSVLHLHSLIMVEGSEDVLVPWLVVKHSTFDLALCLFDCGHDHCPEVLGFENYNFIVILFALFVVCTSAEQVGFLVCCPGLWWREKWYSANSVTQCTCRQFSFWGFRKYWRFWWSVQILKSWAAPIR